MTKAVIEWSIETIAALSLDGLENLRKNAIRLANHTVIDLCDAELKKRKPAKVKLPITEGSKTSRAGQYVGGYHFVCPGERGVIRNDDGTLWTGTWVVEKSNAEASTMYGAYVALHVTKSEPSYIQGNLKDWRSAERDQQYVDGQLVKIPMGIDFLLEPTDQPYHWIGDGSGEKGYAWKEVSK